MSRTVLALDEQDTAHEALGYLLDLGVSTVPVLDAERKPIGVTSWRRLLDAPAGTRARDRTDGDVLSVLESDTIDYAAAVLEARDVHRIFVVDAAGALVGSLAGVDVLRALRGGGAWPSAPAVAAAAPETHPSRPPATVPRRRRSEEPVVTWTEPAPFELASYDTAPNGPGVLLVVESLPGEPDMIALVETPSNVRARLLELLLNAPTADVPRLSRWLSDPSGVRFRAAAIDDPGRRMAVARGLVASAEAQRGETSLGSPSRVRARGRVDSVSTRS